MIEVQWKGVRLRGEYPELEDEDVRQALAYAAANLADKILELHEE
ncbi:MAG: hypothetical protein U1A77_24615 [Pirellulales bacterium]